MGNNDPEVKRKLGEDAVKLILSEVSRGNINTQKMQDIAQKLGDKVGGNHGRRGKNDEAEMRNILSDWWSCEDLCEKTRAEALEQLIELFSSDEICLKPISNGLKTMLQVAREMKEVSLSNNKTQL